MLIFIFKKNVYVTNFYLKGKIVNNQSLNVKEK